MLRWTSAGGDRRRRPAAARRAAVRRLPRATPSRWSRRPSWRASAFTEAHLRGSRPVGWRAASAIAVEVGRAAAPPASASSTPTTAASTRRPTSGASASSTTPSCASPTALVADVLERPAARRRAARDRRPRPGRGRRPHRRPRPATCWRWSPSSRARAGSAGGTPRRGAADDLAKAATERYEDVAWVVTREQIIDEHWFGPTIAAADGRPPRRRRARRRSPRSASTTRPTPARSSCLPPRLAHAAEVLVPLLAGRHA